NVFIVEVIAVNGSTDKTITIYNASSGYVSYTNSGCPTSGANEAGFKSSVSTKEQWKSTISSGLWRLTNVGCTDRTFQWNSSATRFAGYRNATQIDLKLYKKEASTPCDTETLTAGTTVASTTEVASGGSVNLSLDGASTGTGLTYQWQSSANGSSWA